MGFALIPLIVLAMTLGLTMQAELRTHAIAGVGSRIDAAATVREIQARAFAVACVEAARQAPNVVSSNLSVILPVGMTQIAGAQCATQATGAGRQVYASVPSTPGAAAGLMTALNGSATWYQVVDAGIAERLSNGERVAVPSGIAASSLLYQTGVTP